MKKIMLLLPAALMLCAAANAQMITSTTSVSERKIQFEKPDINVWYQGEWNLGYATCDKIEVGTNIDTDFSRVFLSTIHGARITKYGYAGIGAGLQYAYGKIADYEDSDRWNTMFAPIFANVRAYYPISDDLEPYISISFGSSICFTSALNETYDDESSKMKGGAYAEYGVGLSAGKWNIALGIQSVKMKLIVKDYYDTETGTMSSNSFFFKIGKRF